MYRKDSDGWLKHADFMLLDMICLQLSFILAYALRGMEMDLYSDVLYRNMAVFLCLADLVVIFTAGTMKSVLKRGYYKEFVATMKQSVIVGVLAIIYLFVIQEGQSFPVGGEEAIVSVGLLEAVYRSAKTGVPVRLGREPGAGEHTIKTGKGGCI